MKDKYDLGLGSEDSSAVGKLENNDFSTPAHEENVSSESPSTDSTPVDIYDITIGDKKAPIILLFGPPASGKSMTLVRLARYLRKNGYVVKADPTFKSDSAYQARCKEFHKNLSTTEALSGTALDEFLMVKVIKHGKTLCQILEAAGEDYFDPGSHHGASVRDFPPYLTEIIRNLPNRKIWLFMMEAQWNVPATIKDAYVNLIKGCKNQLLQPSNPIILLYNKVDQKDELFEGGRIHIGHAEKAMKDEYEGVANIFKNGNPITSLWRPYNYTFVPFVTGIYNEQMGGTFRYTESEERYPKNLWSAIQKCLKG